MNYSALVFADGLKTDEDYISLKEMIQIFQEDEDCKQIVLSAPNEWTLRLAQNPFPHTILVKMSKNIYITLLNGLKAITQDDVVVVRFSDVVNQENVKILKEELLSYPAVSYNRSLQGFDTRLVMFCLQVAIESNMAIDTYASAVEALGNTPIKYI